MMLPTWRLVHRATGGELRLEVRSVTLGCDSTPDSLAQPTDLLVGLSRFPAEMRCGYLFDAFLDSAGEACAMGAWAVTKVTCDIAERRAPWTVHLREMQLYIRETARPIAQELEEEFGALF